MREFLAKSGLPLSALPETLKAMAHDSQQGILGKRGNDHVRLDSKYWAEVDACMEEFGCPVRSSMDDLEVKRVLFGRPKED